LLRSSFEQQSSPEGEAVFHYIAELADHFLPPGEPSEKVYRLIQAIVEAVHQGLDTGKLLLYFDVWILKLSGFFPHLERCVRCGRMLGVADAVAIAGDGAPECLQCHDLTTGVVLTPAVREEVRRILTQPPSGWAPASGSFEAVRRLREFVQSLIHRVLERELRAERFVDYRF
jgi:DNA repair protein RecO